MNLVTFALRRPISLLTMVLAIALAGLLAVDRMSRDIFPDLGVPVLYVAQPYGGMDPAQMEGFITNYYEYHFLYITGIQHVESRIDPGRCADEARTFIPAPTWRRPWRRRSPTSTGLARLHAAGDGTAVRDAVRHAAACRSATWSSRARQKRSPRFRTRRSSRFGRCSRALPGVSAPPPFGGSQRTIVVRLDPDRLRSYNMSPDEVVQALAAGNTVSPSGNVRIGDRHADGAGQLRCRRLQGTEQHSDPLARNADDLSARRRISRRRRRHPDRLRAGQRTSRRLHPRHQTGGRLDARGRSGRQSQLCHAFKPILPDDIKVSSSSTSPPTSRALSRACSSKAHSARCSPASWCSCSCAIGAVSLVVVLNIPLAILASVTALWLSGQTINLMTLGGLALAVGILVDEATVDDREHPHPDGPTAKPCPCRPARPRPRRRCPVLLAMLCILAVFIPAFFMHGAAHKSVRAAGPGSRLLDGWVVSAFQYLCAGALGLATAQSRTRHEPQETFFDRLRVRYDRFARVVMKRRRIVVFSYLVISGAVILLVGSTLGTEIFPVLDTGQLQLHLRAPAGTRIERTEQIALQTLDVIKREVGPDNIDISLGFVGTQPPNYPINTIYLWSSGSEEAVLQVQLKRGAGIRIEDLKERLRQTLPRELPGVRFSFEPSDIVSRVMSVGAPTPIEVAVSGPNFADSRQYADKLRAKLALIPTLRDLAFEQELDYPTVKVTVDRERAGVLGVTTDDVAKSVVAGTSSSRYTSANYWADPKSGIGYQVQVEIPEHQMNSLEEVKNLPIARRPGQQIDLRNVAGVTDGTALGEYDRYNMQRMLTLSANIAGEDLGRAAARVQQAINDTGKPPDRVNVTVRGQIQPMAEMFGGLRLGLLMAVGVILLVLTANFQSFRLSLAVGLTIPAVIAGVVLMLWLTRTTLNIQSFMGAIMAIGVAVANAILLVTFAERSRVEGREPWEAAIEGARGRLRPILMTSCAMLAGMVPMALGLGEGGEQSAPLGRAVIGGLLGATCATLIVLPAILAMLQSRHARISASLDPDDPYSRYFELEPQLGLAGRADGRAEDHARAAE